MEQVKQWVQMGKVNIRLFIKSHFTFILFVVLLLILGVVFGALIAGQLGEAQREDLKIYLQGFFGMIGTKTVANPSDIFQISLWNHLKMVGLIWILGISVVGAPVVVLLLFLKGAMLGFSIGLLVLEFGTGGLLLSAGTIFPQNILIVPCWIIMATLALVFSAEMMKYMLKHEKVSISRKMLGYHFCFIIIGISFVLPTGYEAFISPEIMTFIAEKILL